MSKESRIWGSTGALALACLGAALPVIVSTIHGLSEGWVPYGDQAVIASQAYDVFTTHTPLVGQYSASWHLVSHATFSLGPMLYWLLALPARVGAPGSLTVAMGLVNAAAIAGVVTLARRRGGPVLMLATALAVALMCRSLVPETYHDIWNPSAAVIPFTLLIFLGWSVACGEYRLLPLTVLVASFVVQCHLTYVAPTLAVGAVGLAGLALSRRRLPPEHQRGSMRRWAAAAVVVALICWSAPVVDQLTHNPGNLQLVVQAGTTKGSKVGWDVGWHALVRAGGAPPWWLTVPTGQFDRADTIGPSPPGASAVSCALLLAALAVVGVVGLRRRRVDVAAAAAIGLGLSAALVVVTARTPANPHLAATLGYTLWWGSPAGMSAWLALAWSVTTLLPAAALPRVRRRLAGARAPAVATAAGTVAVLAVGGAVAAAEKPDDHQQMYRAIRTMAERLRGALPAGRTVSLYGSPGITSVVRMGLRYDLRRANVRAVVPGGHSRWGPWYVLGSRSYDDEVYLQEAGAPPAPAGRVIARVGFLLGSDRHLIAVSVSRVGERRPRSLRH